MEETEDGRNSGPVRSVPGMECMWKPPGPELRTLAVGVAERRRIQLVFWGEGWELSRLMSQQIWVQILLACELELSVCVL